MTGPRLVIVGDALLDCDVDGAVERLAQDAPAPVLDERDRIRRPGGAGLAATMAAADGARVALVSPVGDDEAGDALRDLLARAGVELIAVPSTGPTAEKIRLRTGGRTLLRLDRGGAGAEVERIPAPALELLETAEVVLVSDYGRSTTRRPELHAALRRRRRPTVWDPHPRGADPTPGTTLVTPNLSELPAGDGAGPGPDTSGQADDGLRSVAARTEAARRRWDVRAVVTTRGPDGAIMATGSGTPLVVPGRPVNGDPCGAGDRFASAAAVGLLEGMVLAEAVTAAVRAAEAHVAAGVGALTAAEDGSAGARGAAARPSRVAPAAAAPGAGLPGPVASDARVPGAGSVAEVLGLVRRVQDAGGTVVVAGGCFDVLHAGHAALLEGARGLGDLLVVALNSDASVRRLKGPGRPVVPEHDRAALLRSLASVDAVAIFTEDGPTELLRRLRPDVFVKGGDYAERTLPEAAVMAEWGGQAAILPYLSGRSTTGLLRAGRA
jgi:D-beta-D-heptose 7-phosphate kinase/D-beta-D-heptose 1-phosphate adenosyltransferase